MGSVVPIVCVVAAASVRTAEADPPDRVARMSYVSGPVSFRPSNGDAWSAAMVNYPLTVGDHLWIDRSARAELDLGSSFVRMAPATEFSIVNLDDRLAQVRVTQGALVVRVGQLDPGDAIEIDTPTAAVSLIRSGFYRIDVPENGAPTTVTVRSGEAEVSAGGSPTLVAGQRSLIVTGDAPWSIAAPRAADDFENWCLARDRHVETSTAARYVSPEMVGYADLDPYGQWQEVADFGPVWIPRVNAAWVPYRYGHWTWIDPWGWTWIDDEPWGFAPCHYGRWIHLSYGWAWVPGRRIERPVYAPALVAFVGGAGWQASLRFESAPVAWFPLGPREPFIPAYRVSDAYVQRVNITQVNVTNVHVTNINYVNRAVPGAVTAVPRDAFVRARPVAANAVAVPRDAIRNAPVASASVAAPTPVRGAELLGRQGAAPPQAAIDRPVIVRHAPPDSARITVRERTAAAPPRRPATPGVVNQPPPQQPPPVQRTAEPRAVERAPQQQPQRAEQEQRRAQERATQEQQQRTQEQQQRATQERAAQQQAAQAQRRTQERVAQEQQQRANQERAAQAQQQRTQQQAAAQQAAQEQRRAQEQAAQRQRQAAEQKAKEQKREAPPPRQEEPRGKDKQKE
jgi:DNA segregation ATPase FtsK/SpoIIIE-like protein